MSESVPDQEAESGEGGGDRPYVSLLFADLCNSTPLGEGIDPEELVNLRQQIEGIAIQVVEKHGGKVNPIHGDGVLAVFGHPTPTENDARRAVEAAVELHELTRQPVWTSMPRGFEVRLHSAVHAGRVFAQKGDALHGRYDLLGDAVNTASRLCEAADRDEILVSDSILSGIEAFFLTEEAGPLP